jgi:hypothetical protein
MRPYLLFAVGCLALWPGVARPQSTHALAGGADPGDWGALLTFQHVADLPYAALPAFRPSFRGAFVGGLPGAGDLMVDGHVGGDAADNFFWAALAGARLAPHGPERTFRPAFTLSGGMRTVPLSPSIGSWSGSEVATHPAVGVARLDVLLEFASAGNPTALTLRIRYETHWTWMVRRLHTGSGAEQNRPLLASQLVDVRWGFVVCPQKPSSFFFESGFHIYSPFQPEERYPHLALIMAAGVAIGGGPAR